MSCLNYDTQQIVKFRGTWQFVTGTCTGGDGLAGHAVDAGLPYVAYYIALYRATRSLG